MAIRIQKQKRTARKVGEDGYTDYAISEAEQASRRARKVAQEADEWLEENSPWDTIREREE